MNVTLRAFAPADAPAVAAVLRAASPYQVVTAELIGWQARTFPAAERYELLVAESAGELIGVARTGLLHESAEPGLAFANLTVRPERRGRGAGSALLAAAEERLVGLGVVTAYAKVADEPTAIAFAERRGYRRGRPARLLHLDLATAELPDPAPPAGVRLATAADLPDPRALYEADLDVSRDEPGDMAMDDISYDDWRTTYWDRPDLDRSLTSVALVGDRVVAFSLALTDGAERYQSGMTGTRRSHRGLGLARAVKLAALRRARDAGYRRATTTNDAGNASMLAVNRRLGYRQVAGEWHYRRELRP